MSRFLDGPAKGTDLVIHRAPHYLRVVVTPTGKIDALDQLDDVAAPRETIHVYHRVSDPVEVHINMGSTRKGSGFYAMADYEHVPSVDGESVRDTEAWRAWCREQPLPGQEPLGL